MITAILLVAFAARVIWRVRSTESVTSARAWAAAISAQVGVLVASHVQRQKFQGDDISHETFHDGEQLLLF